MSKTSARKTSAKRQRPVRVKKAEVVKEEFSLVHAFNGDEGYSQKVKDLDRSDALIYRWTRTQGNKAYKAGKFVVVGRPPKKITETYNPPFVGVTKLDAFMVAGKSEEYYNENNILLNTLPLHLLPTTADLGVVNDLSEGVLAVNIVGTFDDILRQLVIQKVLPEGADTNGDVRDWVYGLSTNQNEYEGWKTEEDYTELVAKYKDASTKKEDLTKVRYEDVQKLMVLSSALHKGAVSVIDVNGKVIADYGKAPTKSIHNVLSDRLYDFFTSGDEEYIRTHIINISNLADTHSPSVSIEPVPAKADGETASNKYKVDGLGGLVFKVGTTQHRLADKIYSTNSAAVAAMVEEIGAVKVSDYSYKNVANKDVLERNFETKMKQMADVKLKRAKQKTRKAIDEIRTA